ncbi:MAG: phage tail tape measure protein [Hyphomicrobiales bacterium]|nr:MAG: phage tail tape measure protein [Hyphomicrobiales bacterium]
MDIASLGLELRTDGLKAGQRELDGLSRASKKAEAAAKGLPPATDRVNASAKRMGASYRVAASSMAMATKAAGALGVVLGSVLSTKASFGFLDALAEVSTLVDTAVFDMERLQTAALAQAQVFGGSATSQTKAFYQLISGGAKTAADANMLLTASNKLAIGGVTDVTTAASGLMAVMNSYGLAADQATNVSDALFVAMKAGTTTIGQLASGIGSVAPLAAKLNVSYDELLATVSALTKATGNTNTAFTGVRAILASIIKPTSEATKMAEKLGIAFSAKGLDEAGGLGNFIKEIVNRTRGSSEAMAQLFGGVEALIPIMQLAGAAGEALSENMFAMGRKAHETGKAFDKMANSPGFQAGRLWAALETRIVSITLGIAEGLVPAMKFMADNMGLVAGAAKIAGTALIVAFAPALITSVAALSTSIAVGLVGALTALKLALLSNPITGIAVLLATGITAFYQIRDATNAAAKANMEHKKAQDLVNVALGRSIIVGDSSTNTMIDKAKADVAAARAALQFANAQYLATKSMTDAVPEGYGSVMDAFTAGIKTAQANLDTLSRTFAGLVKSQIGSNMSVTASLAIDPKEILKAKLYQQRLEDAFSAKDASFDNTSSTSKTLSDYERAIKSIKDHTTALGIDQKVIGLSAYQEALLASKMELTNIAMQDSIGLTPARTAQIEKLSSAYAKQVAGLEAMAKAQADYEQSVQFARDTTGGFIADLRSGLEQGKSVWKSFGDAALNVINKITDRILNQLLDAVFQVNQAGMGRGGGGVGDFFAKMLGGFGGGSSSSVGVDPWAGLRGMATGGYTGDGPTSAVAGVVHKGEYVLNASATKANRGILEAMNAGRPVMPQTPAPMRQSAAPANQNAKIEIVLSPDLEARILEQSAGQAVQISRDSISTYDSQSAGPRAIDAVKKYYGNGGAI